MRPSRVRRACLSSRRQTGIGMTEYALILGSIALVLVLIVRAIGGGTAEQVQRVGPGLSACQQGCGRTGGGAATWYGGDGSGTSGGGGTPVQKGTCCGENIATDGLQSYYPLNERGGATAFDDGPANTAGNMVNVVPSTAAVPGAYFNGTNAYIRVSDTLIPNYNPVYQAPSNVDATLTAWFETTTPGPILGNSSDAQPLPGSSNCYAPMLFVDGNGLLQGSMGWDQTAHDTSSTTRVNDGRWHMASLSHTVSGTDTLYLDGQQVAQRTGLAMVGWATACTPGTHYQYYLGAGYLLTYVGAQSLGRQEANGLVEPVYFHGSIADVASYSKPLTAAQIQQNYVAARATYSGSNPGFVAPVAAGLLAQWPFTETAGTVAADSAGGHAGTLSGGITLSQYPGDGVFDFNGSTGIIDVGNPPALQLATGTMSAWVRSTPGKNTSGYRTPVCKSGAYCLFTNNGRFDMYDYGTSTEFDCGFGTAAVDGRWHLITVTFQSGVTNGTTCWLDGIQGNSATTTVASQTYAPVTLGAYRDYSSGLGDWWWGQLGTPALYGTTLSAAQIAQNFRAGPPGQ